MIRLLLGLSFIACSCTSMSMVAKSMKTMTVKGPNGSEKTLVEHLSTSDLDGSATGYIYQSNGNQPATIVKFSEQGFDEPRGIRQLIPLPQQPFFLLSKPKHFREKGREYDADKWRSHGLEGSRGYRDFDTYNVGLEKNYHRDGDSGFYKHSQGKKNSHHDEGALYGSFDESKKGESGEYFEKEKTHKKGHKTTGYHNIYHKDEYKKQHSFYDEASDSGHYDKYGKNVDSYDSEKGGYKKADRSDSAYQESDHSKKGGFDRGNFSEGSKEFREAAGDNNHFSRNSEYEKKGGNDYHKSYGFDNVSGLDLEN